MKSALHPVSPHTRSYRDIAAELEVRLGHGLDSDNAAERARVYGLNVIEQSDRTSFLKKFIAQFHSVLILILLLAAIVAGLMREFQDTIVILIGDQRMNGFSVKNFDRIYYGRT